MIGFLFTQGVVGVLEAAHDLGVVTVLLVVFFDAVEHFHEGLFHGSLGQGLGWTAAFLFVGSGSSRGVGAFPDGVGAGLSLAGGVVAHPPHGGAAPGAGHLVERGGGGAASGGLGPGCDGDLQFAGVCLYFFCAGVPAAAFLGQERLCVVPGLSVDDGGVVVGSEILGQLAGVFDGLVGQEALGVCFLHE